jgi:hypothetical protein
MLLKLSMTSMNVHAMFAIMENIIVNGIYDYDHRTN